MNASILQFAQNEIEEAVSATHEMLNCRSLSDMTAVQNRFATQSFERFVHEANRLAQAAANMAKQNTRAA